MSIQFVVTIIVSIVSALVGGGIVTYYIGRRDKEKENAQKGLITSKTVDSTVLVNPDCANLLSLSTSINFPKGSVSRKKTAITVINGYQYVISITNSGLDTVTKPEINITFEEDAYIHYLKVNPGNITDDKIDYPENKQEINSRLIIPAYLNSGDNISISVVVLNTKMTRFPIKVTGENIRYINLDTEIPAKRTPIWTAVLIVIALLVVLFLINGYPLP